MSNPEGFLEAVIGRKGIPVRRGMTEQDRGWMTGPGKGKNQLLLKI